MARTLEDVTRDITVHGETIVVDLLYPNVNGNHSHICVGLVDVRAADDIRISYDFERDGWLIEQSATEEYPQEWVEAAFIPAWGKVRK